MARAEIFSTPGDSLYGFLWNSDTGDIWNGSAWASWNAASWATYAVAMFEHSPAGHYWFDVPAGINTSTRLTVTMFRMIGGSPASGDDQYGSFTKQYTGTAWSDGGGSGGGGDVTSINGSTTAAANLAISAATMVTGLSVAGTLSVSQMSTNLTHTVANILAGRVIYFTSGALMGRVAAISGYAVTGGILTFYSPLPSAPAVGVSFVII